MTTLQEQIGQAGTDLEKIAEQARARPASVEELLNGLGADKARVKFGCAKVLHLVSQSRPELLYPHFEAFARLLDSPNKIFQWEAILILSHLARVDEQNKFGTIFDRYFAPIAGPVMITAGNILRAAPTIAQARPAWAGRIAGEMLKVQRARYQTAECRNVAIGHAITALGEMVPLLEEKEPVFRFVRKQLRNTRAAVRRKAGDFLKKHGRAGAVKGGSAKSR